MNVPEMDWGPLWLTLQLAGVTVVVLLVVGTPLAWWLAFTRSRLRTLVEAIVALPIVLSTNRCLASILLIALGPHGLMRAARGKISPARHSRSPFTGLSSPRSFLFVPFVVHPARLSRPSAKRAAGGRLVAGAQSCMPSLPWRHPWRFEAI